MVIRSGKGQITCFDNTPLLMDDNVINCPEINHSTSGEALWAGTSLIYKVFYLIL